MAWIWREKKNNQCNATGTIQLDSIRYELRLKTPVKSRFLFDAFDLQKNTYWQIFNRRWKSISILSHLMSIVVRYTQSTVCLNGETNRRCKVKVVIFVLDFTSEHVEITYVCIDLFSWNCLTAIQFDWRYYGFELFSFDPIHIVLLTICVRVYALVIFLSILNALHSFPSICSESELLIVNNALCFAHFWYVWRNQVAHSVVEMWSNVKFFFSICNEIWPLGICEI